MQKSGDPGESNFVSTLFPEVYENMKLGRYGITSVSTLVWWTLLHVLKHNGKKNNKYRRPVYCANFLIH